MFDMIILTTAVDEYLAGALTNSCCSPAPLWDLRTPDFPGISTSRAYENFVVRDIGMSTYAETHVLFSGTVAAVKK
jgi:hypothetical protein